MCVTFPMSSSASAKTFFEFLRLALFCNKALIGETPHSAAFLLMFEIIKPLDENI